MPHVRGQAVTMALLAITAGLGSLAQIGQGSPDDPHPPIRINGDQELRSNVCSCVRNPGASGTANDPFIIADWDIQTAGTAIVISNIKEEHFVVKDNSLDGDTGIVFDNTGDRGRIYENAINFRETGIRLKHSATHVSDNSIQNTHAEWDQGTTGVDIRSSAARLDDNYISLAHYGVLARSASPEITDNEIVNTGDAIRLRASTDARIENNIIRLADHWGVFVAESAHARLISNEIREGEGGVVSLDAKLFMQNNRIINQRSDAVRFQQSVVKMFRNNITDNWRGAFGSKNSDVVIEENVFRDNGDGPGKNDNAGLRLAGSEGRVVANRIVGNDLGIKLDDTLITLEDNVLLDNRWGLSIPYDSKGSIPLMSGNYVNGLNVDGTERPADQRIFYEEVGISIENETIDSGHNDSRFGTLFKQGALVVYDSQDVTIQDNDFNYNDVGVRIQGSTFVRVRDNTFLSNQKAVISIDSRTFIKDNECDIEIDPPQTICFKGKGGFVTVRSNLAAHVAIGVKFTASTEGEIDDNTIRATTKAGLQLEGSFEQTEHDVTVEGNTMEENRVGVLMIHFKGTLEGNLIANSTWTGVKLMDRSNATFIENRIILNAKGVVDAEVCPGHFKSPCSSGVFVENKIKANAGVGVKLQDGGLFEGDVIVDNKVGADLRGDIRMTGVNASANAKTGARVEGSLTLKDSNVSANGKHGIEVAGEFEARDVNASLNAKDGIRVDGAVRADGVIARNNSDDGADLRGHAKIEDGNFSGNAEAGLRIGGTLFVVEDCEASANLNGVIVVSGDIRISPNVPVPEPPSIPDVPDVSEPDLGDDDDGDPLWMHECDLVGNKEFALKANVEARVNATHNFWGKDGPKIDTPLIKDSNVISANARVSPYYESRQHEDLCFVPSTELDQRNESESAKACLEA